MLTTAVGRYVPQALALWRRHPVEALLAVLGVVGGVAGLVAVMTMAQGARIELQRALGALGTGTMIVRGVGTARIGAGRAAALSSLLGDDLRHRVSVMQHASAVRSAYAEVAAAKIVATEREYAAAYGLSVAEGRFIAAYDVAREARVCVLGAQLARQLFPRGDALGSRMRLGTEWHTVIGVLASERRAAAPDDLGIDQDRLAIVPLAPVSRRTALDELLLQFADETDMTRAAAAVQRIVEYGSADGGFEYVMPIELMREKRRMQRVVTWLLAGVTGVLLVVGGISVANVMLLSVMRRRTEIGLRRAVGAARRAIVEQFVYEGVLICGIGGVLGVLAGVGATLIVGRLADWPVGGAGSAAFVGLAVSVAVGLAAASYPAWQAARVEPMRALA